MRPAADRRQADLRAAYDRDAERRSATALDAWRVQVLDDFVSRVPTPGERRAATSTSQIVDLGCGAGQVAAHLRQAGAAVTAVDLSWRNAQHAAARDMPVVQCDFAQLPLRDSVFDGAIAFNTLLHVPADQLPAQFAEIRRVLVAGAVLTTVTWGGRTQQGPLPDDWTDPPRFFSLLHDDDLLDIATPGFERITFSALDVAGGAGLHPQVLVLRATPRGSATRR